IAPATGLTTTESGGTASFSAVLSMAPTGTVLVDIVSLDTTEVISDKAQLAFTPSDWMTPQLVTLSGVNDTLTDGNIGVTIQTTINAASTDASGFKTTNPVDVSVTNMDNEPVSQGTSLIPLNITGATPYPGAVAGAGSSFYYITGLTSGVTYFFSLSTLTSPATFVVYSNSTYATALCTGNQSATNSIPKSCSAAAPASGIVYIKVLDGTPTTDGSTYKLDVTLQPTAQGSTASPVNITGLLPYNGTVSGTSSYYVVTGLTPGAVQAVSTSNQSANIDLFVYSNATFTTLLCSSNASNIAEICTATVPGSGAFYIKTTLGGGMTLSSYIINVGSPPVAQGASGAPVDITGLLPYPGTMVSPGSYYVVTGLTPGTVYTVMMTEMTGGGSLGVYADVNFTTQPGSYACIQGATNASGYPISDGGGNLPESCTAAANASGKLFIKADPTGLTATGATTFNVRVQ
ncbi:MAG: hypothetical protein OEW39_00675, partial [Deltaproteobacteria bacterium]|nr:hypothetical protein [Deltaproteobacteria bacterium]